MIRGSCFTLRHVQKEDLSTYLSLHNNLVARGDYLPLDLMLHGSAEKKIEEERFSKDLRETFLIIDDKNEIIGSVFHFKTVPYFNSREIGYGMYKEQARGKGVMTEAVKILASYLFKTLQINRLEIHTHIENHASEKVAIKCGFIKEGIARGAHFSRGQHVDIAMYALLRGEWEQLPWRELP